MPHATEFPLSRNPERLRPVSARRSGTLRRRACRRKQHNARVLLWPFQGVQIAQVDSRNLHHILIVYPDPDRKVAFAWVKQTFHPILHL
jgi:hypothetical protein